MRTAKRWLGVWIALMPVGTVCAQFASTGMESANPLAVTSLDFAQAGARLRQVSDAVAAADANVRNKEQLSEASRRLRLPEISADVRRMELQKTLTLPVGTLAPVARQFGLPSQLEFVNRDWYTRPILSATLPIYTGGLIPAAQGAARAAVRQADAERDAQAQNLNTQLVQAYFGQRLAEQVAIVRRDVRDGLDRHLHNAVALEREGFATRAQRLQVQVARDKAERDYLKSLNDLATIREVLATLLHVDGAVATTTPLFVSRTAPASLADFQARARDEQPQVKKMQAMVDQAEQGVRVQQASLKPVIYAFGQYDLYRHDALLTDPDWAFGIGIKYTFVSGQGRQNKIRAARDQQEQAEAGLRETRNQVRMGVVQAWQAMDTARQQYLLLKSSITQAEENLRLQELSFREGQSTSLDVIDARMSLGGARVERAQAAYEYDVALAKLLEVSGQSARFGDYIKNADEVVNP